MIVVLLIKKNIRQGKKNGEKNNFKFMTDNLDIYQNYNKIKFYMDPISGNIINDPFGIDSPDNCGKNKYSKKIIKFRNDGWFYYNDDI